MENNFFIGIGYLVRGFRCLNRPGYRRYVWLPILTNILILLSLLYAIGGHWEELIWQPGETLQWLAWILIPLTVVLLLLLSGYVFSTLTLLIASPFYGLLAGKVESDHGIVAAEENLLQLTVRTFGRELTKLMYYAPRYALLFLLAFVPGMVVIIPFLAFWFGAWVTGLQYSDYSYDNQGRSFRDSRHDLGAEIWTTLGFGAVTSLLMTVPVLNCFVPPAAVIGATLWRCERIKPRPAQRPGTPPAPFRD